MLYWVIMIDYYVSVLYVIIIDYIVDSFKEYILNLSEAYSGVIAACGTHGKYDTAKGLLDEMRQFQVESNAVVLNAAMSAFIKCGILGDAYQIYYDMSKQQVRPDLETYNTLMQSFVQQSYWEGALHTLETIRSSTQDPDAWTWFGWFWMIIYHWFTIDLPLIYHWFTYIFILYLSCILCPEVCGFTFLESSSGTIASAVSEDAISYTTAIDACRKGSFWQEAIHLCWEMRLQHVQPDIITFGPAARKMVIILNSLFSFHFNVLICSDDLIMPLVSYWQQAWHGVSGLGHCCLWHAAWACPTCPAWFSIDALYFLCWFSHFISILAVPQFRMQHITRCCIYTYNHIDDMFCSC